MRLKNIICIFLAFTILGVSQISIASTNSELDTAITIGAKRKLLQLVDKGADVNAKIGEDPFLINATLWGHPDIVEILLNRGADVNALGSQNCTALIVAAMMGREKITQILLDNGADTDKKNIDGDTALILAATVGHTNIVRALINKGADITITNNQRTISPR